MQRFVIVLFPSERLVRFEATIFRATMTIAATGNYSYPKASCSFFHPGAVVRKKEEGNEEKVMSHRERDKER